MTTSILIFSVNLITQVLTTVDKHVHVHYQILISLYMGRKVEYCKARIVENISYPVDIAIKYVCHPNAINL